MTDLELIDGCKDRLIISYPSNEGIVIVKADGEVFLSLSQATELRDYLNTILNQDK